MLFALALVAASIAAAVDARTLRLPNRLTLGLLVLFLSAQVAGGHGGEAFVASAACFVASLVLAWASDASIGGADAKLCAAIGAALGWRGIPVVVLAFAALDALPPRLHRPFAPLIAAATFLVVLLEILG